MYARLEQEFQGEYLCGRCEHVAHLEARIIDLEEQNATLRAIDNLERGILLTERAVSGVNRGGGEMEQEVQASSFVNNTRGSRGGAQKRKASPVSALPCKIAKLGDDARASVSEMATLAVTALPDSRENSPASSRGDGNAGRTRQLVVIGDSIIRKTDRIICMWWKGWVN